eukprot:6204952-Pleurochrysis_carterae.AAC.8
MHSNRFRAPWHRIESTMWRREQAARAPRPRSTRSQTNEDELEGELPDAVETSRVRRQRKATEKSPPSLLRQLYHTQNERNAWKAVAKRARAEGFCSGSAGA